MRLHGILALRRTARDVAGAQLGVAAQVRARREAERAQVISRATGNPGLGAEPGDWRLALARRASLVADLSRATDLLAAAAQDEAAAAQDATRARVDFAAVEKAVQRRNEAERTASDRAEAAELADVVASLRAHRLLTEGER